MDSVALLCFWMLLENSEGNLRMRCVLGRIVEVVESQRLDIELVAGFWRTVVSLLVVGIGSCCLAVLMMRAEEGRRLPDSAIVIAKHFST